MTSPEILAYRQLNRSLLARQHLLERTDRPAPELISYLVGLQAQSPDAPYVGLWNRIRDFDPSPISEMVASRRLIRLTTLRGTIHLHPIDEALWIRPILQPMLTTLVMGPAHRRDLRHADIEKVLQRARAIVASGSLSRSEMATRLTETWPGRDGSALAFLATMALPMEQAAPRGVWRANVPTRWQLIPEIHDWPSAVPHESEDMLVRRYLRSFGPASVRDVARWSGMRRVRAVIDRLANDLRTFRSPTGEVLFDVPDGLIVAADVPAPVRLLPEFDNVLLSHHDRGRVMSARHKPPIPAGDGGRSGSMLVDGMFHGTWGIVRHKDGTATLTVAPFSRVTAAQTDELRREVTALMAFIAPDATSWELDVLPTADPVAGRHGVRG